MRFTASEIALTHQLALMVAFMPRFNSQLTPLTPAATALARVLAQRQAAGAAAVAALFAAKAAALRRFEATTAHITPRLGLLTPPPALRPEYEAQRGRIARLATLAQAITSERLRLADTLR